MITDVHDAGYRLCLASVYPLDTRIPSASLVSWFVTEFSKPGSIIVIHDGARRRKSVAVLMRVLPELRRRGYEIVTVSELVDAQPDGQ